MKHRRLAAVGAALLAVATLTGCMSGYTYAEQTEEGMVGAHPNIAAVEMTASRDIAGWGAKFRIYVTDTSDQAVADSLDAALEAFWHAAPLNPETVFVDADSLPMPRNPEIWSQGIDLDPAVEILGWEDHAFDGSVLFNDEYLEERYGPRESSR